MSPETLITIISFTVAVYALLPSERLLDLKIKFAWYDRLIVAAAILIILYMLYIPVLEQTGLALALGPWRWGFTPALATFSILAVTAAWIGCRLHFGGLGRQRIFAFGHLATKLLEQQKFGELAELVERHLPRLMKIYNNEFVLVRLRNWFAPPTWAALADARSPSKTRPAWIRWLAPKLAALLPRHEATRDTARQTVQRIMLSERFAHEISLAYPYLGLDILSFEFRERYGFQEYWLGNLLDDPNSVIYGEIEHNQSNRMGAYHRYEYRSKNRYLWFYFNDVSVAEDLKFYKALGDYYCAQLNSRFRNPDDDRFNQPTDRYPDIEIWRCPAHAVLRLFDYMVSEAFYQNIGWHMWLHYLTTFADKTIRNLAPRHDVNPDSEFPTPYHYHLYEIVSLLCNWIACAKDQVINGQPTVDERHIPMQSVIALGRVMNMIVMSARLDDRFTKYMLEVVIGRAHDWRDDPLIEPYADALIAKLAQGGRDWSIPDTWPAMLIDGLNDVDFVRYADTVAELTRQVHAVWGPEKS